ncbi:MAG: HIT family protein [bacterium]|nr:HIT family protein [bacterium]
MNSVQDKNIIHESLHWRVILMPDQTYLGRSVVVLKRKCGDLAEVTHEEILDFMDSVVIRLENAFRVAFGATMFNWTCLMNNAYLEEIPDPQVHWHFRPRYRKPVEFEGELFSDQNFGHHYELDVEKLISKELREEIVKKVQLHL